MNKEKISNFFYYNKTKIILAIILVIVVGVSLNQCRNNPETSLGILYATENPGVSSEKFVKAVVDSKTVKTSENKSAETENILFKDIYLSPDENELMQSRALEQMQVEIAGGNCKIIISDDDTMYSYSDEEAFCDITDYADKYNIADSERYKVKDGKTIGISIADHTLFKSCGVPSDGLYITVRNHTEKENAEYKNAFNMLEYVLKNK